MTHAELLEVIYRFYPRGMHTTAPGYDDTSERCRQADAQRVAVADYHRWKAMLGRLRARFEVQDRSLHIISGRDAGFSGHVEIPGRLLGFHVSFLGPYHAVHRTGSAGEEPAASEIAREVETTYGYEPVPPEIGDLVVPDVALDTRRMGEVTIYECLLSEYWQWSSEPQPPA